MPEHQKYPNVPLPANNRQIEWAKSIAADFQKESNYQYALPWEDEEAYVYSDRSSDYNPDESLRVELFGEVPEHQLVAFNRHLQGFLNEFKLEYQLKYGQEMTDSAHYKRHRRQFAKQFSQQLIHSVSPDSTMKILCGKITYDFSEKDRIIIEQASLLEDTIQPHGSLPHLDKN